MFALDYLDRKKLIEEELKLNPYYVEVTDVDLKYIKDFLRLNPELLSEKLETKDLISITELYNEYVKMLKDLHIYDEYKDGLYQRFKEYIITKYKLKYIKINKDFNNNSYHELYTR